MVGVLDESELVDFIKNTFHMTVMPFSLFDGLGIRIGLAMDVLQLSIFPFIMMGCKTKEKVLIAVLTFLCVVINFSRIYFAQYFCLLFVAIFSVIDIHRVPIKRTLALGLGFALVIAGLVVSYGIWGGTVEDKFFGVAQETSDLSRIEQIVLFSQAIPENIFFGNGLGSYLPTLIRDEDAMYSYEVELLAIAYQFGLVGILVIGSIFFCMIKRIYIPHISMQMKLLILCSLLFVILRSATNPLLWASNNIMVFVVMLVYARREVERTDRLQEDSIKRAPMIEGAGGSISEQSFR